MYSIVVISYAPTNSPSPRIPAGKVRSSRCADNLDIASWVGTGVVLERALVVKHVVITQLGDYKMWCLCGSIDTEAKSMVVEVSVVAVRRGGGASA